MIKPCGICTFCLFLVRVIKPGSGVHATPTLSVMFVSQVKRKEPQELAEDASLKRVRPSTPPDEEDEGEIFRLRAGAVSMISADSHSFHEYLYITSVVEKETNT